MSADLGPRFVDALAYAAALHREQRRKGSAIPYVSHLLGVAALAIEAGANEDQAIAALLHDAVEGAARLAEIERRFGTRVAQIVSDCTDCDAEPKPPWRARKEAYVMKKLSAKSIESLLVSLADKTHNAGAIVADLHAHGASVQSRFTGGRDGTLWYYAALADAFEAHLPGTGARRLSRLVAEMRALA